MFAFCQSITNDMNAVLLDSFFFWQQLQLPFEQKNKTVRQFGLQFLSAHIAGRTFEYHKICNSNDKKSSQLNGYCLCVWNVLCLECNWFAKLKTISLNCDSYFKFIICNRRLARWCLASLFSLWSSERLILCVFHL